MRSHGRRTHKFKMASRRYFERRELELRQIILQEKLSQNDN